MARRCHNLSRFKMLPMRILATLGPNENLVPGTLEREPALRRISERGRSRAFPARKRHQVIDSQCNPLAR
jgi:hypothetical protein